MKWTKPRQLSWSAGQRVCLVSHRAARQVTARGVPGVTPGYFSCLTLLAPLHMSLQLT